VARLESASAGWKRVVGKVDRILTSPLLRARQTADVFARTTARTAPIEQDPALQPSAPPLQLLERLQAHLAEGLAGIACVGHEPHLGALLGLLLTGNARSPIAFKKGMLAVVELESCANMLGRLVAALSQKVAAKL
jgi:phosphohistidine phosphatase